MIKFKKIQNKNPFLLMLSLSSLVIILASLAVAVNKIFVSNNLVIKRSFADTTYTITASEDTTVKSGYLTSNYGSSTALISSNYSSSNTMYSYMKFNLSSLAGQTVTSATLTIKPSLSRTIEKAIKIVPDSSWRESTMNWGNKPSMGTVVGTIPSRSISAGTPITITLNHQTLQQYAGQTLSLGIDNASSNNTFQYYSSEATSTNRPILTIITDVGTSTGPTPTSPPGTTPPPPTGGTTTLRPIADTYVNSAYPNNNYGRSTYTTVDGSPIRITYIQFDLGSVNSSITNAQMRLRTTSERSTAPFIVKLLSNPSQVWSETSINYNNRLSLGPSIASFTPTSTSTWYTVNVTNSVKSNIGQKITFAIDTSSSDGAYLAARESSYDPELIITFGSGSYLTPTPTKTGATPTPTIRSTPTPTIRATPTPTRVPTPTLSGPTPTTPPLGSSNGLWISRDEIMRLPTSGSAWDRVLSEANSAWGSAKLYDNNSTHDVKTLAGALVSVRTGNSSMRSKTIGGLQSAMNSSLDRALELSRGLQTYIIAADIIGYRTSEFETWVRKMLNASISPHTGGSELCNSVGVSYTCSGVGGVVCTAVRAPNNWGGHARASTIAAALYLNDQTLLNKMVNTHRAFNGERVTNSLYCEDTNWHANPNERYGINQVGTTRSGQTISGVIPEDWRRGGEYRWPPVLTGYMWEGLQGHVVAAVLLHRAGLVNFNSGSSAIVRAVDMLFDINFPPTHSSAGDDTWIPWVVNYYGGSNFPTATSVSGKNMGYTDWTHAR